MSKSTKASFSDKKIGGLEIDEIEHGKSWKRQSCPNTKVATLVFPKVQFRISPTSTEFFSGKAGLPWFRWQKTHSKT